jgi:hypothetical protein
VATRDQREHTDHDCCKPDVPHLDLPMQPSRDHADSSTLRRASELLSESADKAFNVTPLLNAG